MLVEEIHDPVRGFRPGIERVSEVLEAPAVQRLPELIEAVEGAVIPVRRTTERIRLALAEIGNRRREATSRLPHRSGD